MLPDVSKYVVRDPRYPAAEDAAVDVRILRTADQDQSVPAELIDFSRCGMQLRANAQLDNGEAIHVHLRDSQSQFEVGLDGIVKWQRPAGGDGFSVGCKFEEEVDWATLGELFLNGILDRETAI